MAYRTRPRFEAQTLPPQKSSSAGATEVLDRPREAPQRVAARRARWESTPVLDALTEMHNAPVRRPTER